MWIPLQDGTCPVAVVLLLTLEDYKRDNALPEMSTVRQTTAVGDASKPPLLTVVRLP